MGIFNERHMINLTRRVYLLECEAGTQSERDIRPVKPCPKQEYVEWDHERHLRAVKNYKDAKIIAYLKTANKRQAEAMKRKVDTVSKLQSDIRALRQSLAAKEEYCVEQNDLIRTLREGHVVHKCRCVSTNRNIPGAYYRVCECGKGWVLA